MCGIMGQVSRTAAAAHDRNWLPTQVVHELIHRGPNMQGQYSDDSVWLGHSRLSILDTSIAGLQPMTSPDGRYTICYNGEVYNFSEIAEVLGIEGLRSHCDTEVILRAFSLLGVQCFSLFNGMFAFSIYDRHTRRMWLVRDRLGIKPLFYRLNEECLSFASEIKGVLAMSDTPFGDVTAMHEWIYYGNSLGKRTLLEDINRLVPGHYLELDLHTFTSKIEPYWSPFQRSGVSSGRGARNGYVEETRRLLEQAVKRQLVSDVPVGVFLSGGVDSSAITAFASRHYNGRLSTYSVGFDFDEGVNELAKAKSVAAEFGTDHHELHISGVEIPDIVEKMVAHHDMPFSDAANIPLYLLSSRISGSAKVILQGDGGDELFGGYRRYTTLSFQKAAHVIARIGDPLNRFMPHNAHYFRRKRYFGALKSRDMAMVLARLLTEEDPSLDPTRVFTGRIRKLMEESDPFVRYRECQELVANRSAVDQILLVDLMIILPDIFLEKVDRSTMAASIEARVPFLDNDLVDFCLRLPASVKIPYGRKKWLLRRALEGVVPDYILHGRKTGFGVPYGFWLRGALKPLFFDHLATFHGNHPGVLDDLAIRRIYDEHLGGRRDQAFLLWKVLNFMIWANQSGVRLRW